MKIILILLWMVCSSVFANTTGQQYVERFLNYMQWSQNLPEEPNKQFIDFIDSETPLAQRLREKWLYSLARKRDWTGYIQHYKPSKDISLQCFYHLANYYQGNTDSVLSATQTLWLTGNSQPGACNALFDIMFANNQFNEQLISQRIVLALTNRNLALARYLLKQYKKPRLQDEKLLSSIHLNPAKIAFLETGDLHDAFYLYGLIRMVSINMDQAIKFWQSPKTKHLLSQAQQQAFLAHLSLYKAMRNHADTERWFAKIKPNYYDDSLLDWQIRLALKRQNWKNVEQLIHYYQDKENPCWLYWSARSLEARGQTLPAKEIYSSLAKTRNYYGFLASLRLNKKPHFQNENANSNVGILKPYQPITNTIRSLYHAKHQLEASRLLNDFVIELPKEDKSALAYWVLTDLQWHGKALHLSNTEELNNQLSLRFPLAYNNTIKQHAQAYHVAPEFVYAIIRQESLFREDVVSTVGARGLMQIMPNTAKVVAKLAKIPYADQAQLFSSQKNINIGIAYLSSLGKRYKNHPVLMAAAYNAGPRQVNYWLKNHPPKQIDIWIETLPWRETRNYLKNVLAFYAVYQYRMHKKPDLSEFMKPLT